MICTYCEEEILPGELAPHHSGLPLHHECLLRTVYGSVAHQALRCSCYVPGSTEDDPPGLTLRESAQAAVILYNLTRGLPAPTYKKRVPN